MAASLDMELLTTRRARLTWSAVVWWTTLLVAAAAAMRAHGPLGLAFLVPTLVACVAAVSFYVHLGLMAAQLRLSPILWVGGSILFPGGPIIALFMMRGESRRPDGRSSARGRN